MIGFCGFRSQSLALIPWRYPVEQLDLPGWLAEKPEAARAVLRFGFEECDFERVYAGADPPNTASSRVIEKLGMSFDRLTRINGQEAIYYVILREAFESEGHAIRREDELLRGNLRFSQL